MRAGSPNTDSASVTYTPANNYFGTDSFTYKVTDAASGDSNTATASLTITSQNDLPTAGNVSTSAVIGTPKAITLTGGDVETCMWFSIARSPPANGTLGSISNDACAGSGPFTDSASVNYTATTGTSDSFTYRTTDTDSGLSTIATVTISISGGTPVTTTVPVQMDTQVQSGSVNSNYGIADAVPDARQGDGPDLSPVLQVQRPGPQRHDHVGQAPAIRDDRERQPADRLRGHRHDVDRVGDRRDDLGDRSRRSGPPGRVRSRRDPVNGYIGVPVSPAAIHSGALTSLAVKGSTTSSAYFNSRESATNKPELVIVTGP